MFNLFKIRNQELTEGKKKSRDTFGWNGQIGSVPGRLGDSGTPGY
jgi:hypothetical protein